MYVSSVGTKSAESFSVNPIVAHMKLAGAEQPSVSVATSFSVEAFEWSYHWLGATNCNRVVQEPSYQ